MSEQHTAKVWDEGDRTYWECKVCCTGGSSGDPFRAEAAADKHYDKMLEEDDK